MKLFKRIENYSNFVRISAISCLILLFCLFIPSLDSNAEEYYRHTNKVIDGMKFRLTRFNEDGIWVPFGSSFMGLQEDSSDNVDLVNFNLNTIETDFDDEDLVFCVDNADPLAFSAFRDTLQTVKMEYLGCISFYMFSGFNKLTSATFPRAFKVEAYSFEKCANLKHVSIGTDVYGVTIDTETFKGCSNLETIEIPEVGYIYDSAFEDCSSLEEINFPKVDGIEGKAFKGASGLTKIIIGNPNCNVFEDAFEGVGTAEKPVVLNLPRDWSGANIDSETGKWCGAYVKHEHGDWIYSATDNKLEVVCGHAFCDLPDMTLTLEVTSKRYNGEPVVANITNTAEWEAGGFVVPAIIYYKGGTKLGETAPTEPGDYKATISVNGKTASKDFSIYPITYAIIVSNDGMGTAVASKAQAAEGETITLTATPNTGYVFDTWVSDDVTVTDNKFVMPAKEVTVSAKFKLAEQPIPPSNPVPKFKDSKVTLLIGDKASSNFINETGKKATFTSSNKKVVTVDAKGKLTAIKVGKVTITAKVNNKSYKLPVTVKKPAISGKSSVKKGKKITLSMKDAHSKIKWSSSDKKIATIDSKGVVKGIKKGNVTIIAKYNGKKYTKKIAVK